MTVDVLSEARTILRTVRDAATRLEPLPWTITEYGDWSGYVQIRNAYTDVIGDAGPEAEYDNVAFRGPTATLIVLLAGNPKLLNAIDGMLADVPAESGICYCGTDVDKHTWGDGHNSVDMGYPPNQHAENIASEIVNGWKAMQG